MAKKTDIGSSSATQYTRSYGDLRGVDFSADPSQVNASRPSYLVNMYRDYDSEHGAAIETIPGFRRLFSLGGKIHGMWVYSSSQEDVHKEHMVVHAGTRLYTFALAEKDTVTLRFEGLRDDDSTAFTQNNNFYICDGGGIYVMKSEGASFTVLSLEDDAYVPITYLHGAAYEQRNMISDRFINRDTAVVERKYGNYFVELLYLSHEEMEAYLSAYEYTKDTYNGNIRYTITGMATGKYSELDVYHLTLHRWYVDTENPFDEPRYFIVQVDPSKMPWLKRVFVSNDISTSGSAWAAVDEVYVGSREMQNQNTALGGTDFPIMNRYWYRAMIYDPCTELLSVKVDDKEIPEYRSAVAEGGEIPDIFYMPVYELIEEDGVENEYVSYIRIFSATRSDLDARVVDINGVAKSVIFKTAKDMAASKHTDYISANTEYEGTAAEAILGCGVSCTFDGRVFLTGNAKLPNTVFYSCRDLTGYNNPAYYGVYNYFNDGEGNKPNVALLPTSSVLMVLKRGTDGGSAVYYHVGADGIDDVVPRVYPSTPGVAGIGCEGAAINFLDDAVFLSERGLEGVSKEQLNLERTIGHRSSNIDRLLRQSDLSKARMCRWNGYLCIFDGTGQVFLGDSKQRFEGVDGSIEYEWYYLNGIGDYLSDRILYRTVTAYPEVRVAGLPEGMTLEGATLLGQPLTVDAESVAVAGDELYTGDAEISEDGAVYTVSVKYIDRDGVYVLCDTDGERGEGRFQPSVVGLAAANTLFFGTSNGTICCFNVDKRGVSVDGEAVKSDVFHRSWYSFVGHRYLSGLSLRSDDCGVPHLTKRTVRKTCVAKLKTMRGASVNIKIRTDREAWHDVAASFAATDFSFSDMEFDNFSFSLEEDTIITVKDKEKKWVEKQYYFFSDGYCRPFGLHGLTFNYEIQGRVKKG